MADTKITALTALTAADPSTDVLPIVDTSDTTMAASGTTKKISINNILGASGTATLASATITGDLTVDTNTLKVDSANNRVGIGTATPAVPLNIGTAVSRHFLANGQTTGSSYGEITTTGADVIYGAVDAAAGLFTNAIANASFFGSGNATSLQLVTNSTSRYEISSTGVATWSNVGGSSGTAMTLNSTGLGVGTVPANGIKLAAYVTTDGAPATSGTTQTSGSLRIGAASTVGVMDMGTAGSYSWIQPCSATNLATNYNLALNPNGGNVGIGVTPSVWWSGFKAVESSNGVALLAQTNVPYCHLVSNAYDGDASFKYKVSSNYALRYAQDATTGNHIWFNAGLGTAGNAITFTERLRLKETGQLRFVPLASDPAGAEAGDVYYNSTSNKLKCYNGTTWNDLF